MAIGTTTGGGHNVAYELLASATATNGVPSGASAGLSLADVAGDLGERLPESVTLMLWSTAGSGTMTVTCRIWGYHSVVGDWIPLGVGPAASKGTINGGASIDEVEADRLAHAEPLDLPGHFERLYLQITAIGGTATAVTAAIVVGA